MSGEWHYRKQGREHGPVSIERLRQLVESGILSRADMVSEDGQSWMSIGESPLADQLPPCLAKTSAETHDTSTTTRNTSSPAVRSAIAESQCYLNQRTAELAKQSRHRHHRPMTNRLPDWGGIFGLPAAFFDVLIALTSHATQWLIERIGPIIKSKLTWAILAIALTSALILIVPEQVLTQAETHRFLKSTVSEFRHLRENDANEADWESFSTRTHEQLDVMIPKLETVATTDDRISMELLYLARDHLPVMLADAREQSSEAERRFDVHMDRVDRADAENPLGRLWFPGWSIVAVVSICGFLLVCWSFWRRA